MDFNELVQGISATINQEDATLIDVALITNAIVEMQDLYNEVVAERDVAVNDYNLQKVALINTQEANHKLIMDKTAIEREDEEDVEDVIDEKEKANGTLEELAKEW